MWHGEIICLASESGVTWLYWMMFKFKRVADAESIVAKVQQSASQVFFALGV